MIDHYSPRIPIISSDYLYTTIYGPNNRWSRFRRWMENRYDRIGLPYVWPRVERDRIEPKAILMDGKLYAHPLIIDQLKRDLLK